VFIIYPRWSEWDCWSEIFSRSSGGRGLEIQMLFAEPLAQIAPVLQRREQKGPYEPGKPVTLTFTGGTL
jgi:hypothetical protein